MSTAERPPDPTTSPWLHIAAPVGRVAAWFLLGQNVLLLFAPLFFLLDLPAMADPTGPGGSLVLLFSEPARLLSIADLVALVGVVILACAVFLLLFGLVRAERRVPASALLLGLLALACLVAWVPVMAYSLGRARAVTTVDAAAATGGWGLAAVLLLAASLAYMFFAMRLEQGAGAPKVASLRWPIYASANVLGSAVIAGFFQAAAGGAGSLDAFTLGLVLKVTLIPMLGVWAYRDLRDSFPRWAQVPLHEAPRPRPASAPLVQAVATAHVVRPPPTPPVGRIVRPLPPPPDD